MFMIYGIHLIVCISIQLIILTSKDESGIGFLKNGSLLSAFWFHTVDGRNPAPTFMRFSTSQVVQDFFHQQ